jgi:hypothetical protein
MKRQVILLWPCHIGKEHTRPGHNQVSSTHCWCSVDPLPFSGLEVCDGRCEGALMPSPKTAVRPLPGPRGRSLAPSLESLSTRIRTSFSRPSPHIRPKSCCRRIVSSEHGSSQHQQKQLRYLCMIREETLETVLMISRARMAAGERAQYDYAVRSGQPSYLLFDFVSPDEQDQHLRSAGIFSSRPQRSSGTGLGPKSKRHNWKQSQSHRQGSSS